MTTYINEKGELANRYSTNTIVKFSPYFTDTSTEEYKKELLEYLKEFNSNFSTHSMNEGALRLLGEQEMLEKIIEIIETR